MTIFAGPIVESSFNTMDDIIRKDRSSMTIENYEGTAVVRSALKIAKVSATDFQPSEAMVRATVNAHATYQKHVKTKKEEARKRQEARNQQAVDKLKKKTLEEQAKLRRKAALIILEQKRQLEGKEGPARKRTKRVN